jgi:hypothetical protein
MASAGQSTPHGPQPLGGDDRAVDSLSKDIERLTGSGGSGTPEQLEELGALYLERGQLTGSPSDLEDALPPLMAALKARPDRSGPLKFKIATAVKERGKFQSAFDTADVVQTVINIYRDVAQDPTAPAAMRFEAQFEAAHGLRFLHQLTGHPELVDQVIADFERAVAMAEPMHDDLSLARACSDLGTAHSMRYRRLSADADLVSAMGLFQRALKLFPVDAREAPAVEHNLSTCLRNFYDLCGSLSVLDRAINVISASIDHTKPDDPNLGSRRADLGALTLRRVTYGLHLGKVPDAALLAALNRAITLMEEGVATGAEGSNVASNSNLAGALVQRYELLHERDDLTQAIRLLEQARSLVASNSLAVTTIVGNLAYAEFLVAKDESEIDHLSSAIEHSQQAAQSAAEQGSNEYVRFLGTLAEALHLRYQRRGDVADRRSALNAMKQASKATVSAPMAMQLARTWGEWAEEISWAEAADAYGYGLRAMKNAVAGQFLRTEREHWLEVAFDLNARAAFALARTGDLTAAVIALDSSRAILQSSLFESDEGIAAQIGIDNPALRERFRGASANYRAVQKLELQLGQASPDESRQLYDQILSAKNEYEAVLREIGPARSDPEAVFHDIRAAAAGQPLVYLLTHLLGGLALIVNQHGEISVVDLPRLTLDAVLDVVKKYYAAYIDRSVDHQKWRSQLEDTVGWLWDSSMKDVVAAVHPADEIALVPIGLLGLLPLHIAGRRGADERSVKGWVIDRCAVRYVSSARALRVAMEADMTTKPTNVLAIGEPLPVTAPPLPYANSEASIVGSLFPAARILVGGDATLSAIATAMRESAVTHVACHGATVFEDTLSSYLLLGHDERLTVRRMLTLELPRPRLIVLSACETGLIDVKFPDEVIALPSACMQAGFCGAIGAMWSVSDGSTAVLMARFYDLWLRDGLSPSQALRHAQKWLKDTSSKDLARYVTARIEATPLNSQEGRLFDALSKLARYLSAMPQPGNALNHPYYWGAFGFFGV